MDEEGIELPNLTSARIYALKAARDIMASDALNGLPLNTKRHICICDEDGRHLMTVRFCEAVNNHHV